ncbi:glycosyltransferase, partial [uncultured Planktosalinus sp.]|uniref:glycosyltransferase n=1 Tax=uncultured Planktosalinus sp. TaxID=1810935 RepID=UPI0030DA9C21
KHAEIQEKSKDFVPFEFPYIFGIGRMHEIKQFDHLIHAFDRSSAKERGFKLVLMGDGALKSDLQNLVQRKNIENNVVFMEYQENPFPYFRGAHLTALTSKNEGFPNILIESLACETPVVAYDCESGPAEIIIQNENGILVENQNLDAMTRAIETMITDADFYKYCKSMTLKSIERFDFETIGKQWLNFLNLPVN